MSSNTTRVKLLALLVCLELKTSHHFNTPEHVVISDYKQSISYFFYSSLFEYIV